MADRLHHHQQHSHSHSHSHAHQHLQHQRSHSHSHSSHHQHHLSHHTPDLHVAVTVAAADRVLRRAHVSKDRLALANVRLGGLPRPRPRPRPRPSTRTKRKRSGSTTDSDGSELFSPGSGSAANDALGLPFDAAMATQSSPAYKRRGRQDHTGPRDTTVRPAHTQKLAHPQTHAHTWKASYQLPQSSPTSYRPRAGPGPGANTSAHFSAYSDSSTLLDSPSASEDDDADLPLHSFHICSDPSHMPSSPPRTPSPDRRLGSIGLGGLDKAFSPLDDHHAGKEGANLLLYLATSPSPARVNHGHADRAGLHGSSAASVSNQKSAAASSGNNHLLSPLPLPPSTPPSSQTPLPSSMMTTPGAAAGFGGAAWAAFGSTTPNTGFNFAEFCNVTPSPAQRRWSVAAGSGSTPALLSARTPLLATSRKAAAAVLMPPPGGSPNPQAAGKSSSAYHHTHHHHRTPSRHNRGAGLGMDLGGELAAGGSAGSAGSAGASGSGSGSGSGTTSSTASGPASTSTSTSAGTTPARR